MFGQGLFFFFFQAEDGIRDLVRSRGLGDVYKRQARSTVHRWQRDDRHYRHRRRTGALVALPACVQHDNGEGDRYGLCLLYTSDAADERSSVDLGGRRIIKKKKKRNNEE